MLCISFYLTCAEGFNAAPFFFYRVGQKSKLLHSSYGFKEIPLL